MPKIQKASAFAALALAGTLALTGCSGADDADEAKTDATPTEETTEETPATDEGGAEEEPGADGGTVSTGEAPAWFKGSLDAGEQVAEGSTDSWDIKIFQVGTGETDKDSMFVDPDTNENILPAGSEVVFFNAVYTNTTDEAIPLGMIPDPSIRAADWQYLGGQPGSSKEADYEALGLSMNGYDIAEREAPDAPYVVEPGQSVALATSIAYVPGSEAVAKPRFTVKDENGDLDHDKSEEAEITFTVE